MENHSTFNIENVLELENWIVVFAALWKMLAFFWPVVIVAVALFWIEAKKEKAQKLQFAKVRTQKPKRPDHV